MFRFLSFFIAGVLAVLLFKVVSSYSSTAENQGEDRAVARAGLNQLVLFTGSDWCPSCVMLEREVLNTRKWKDFARDEVRFRVEDFPRQISDASRMNLIRQNEIRGFPTMILYSPAGKEISRQMGVPEGGVNTFISWARAHD